MHGDGCMYACTVLSCMYGTRALTTPTCNKVRVDKACKITIKYQFDAHHTTTLKKVIVL